jgi:hypothetical protein
VSTRLLTLAAALAVTAAACTSAPTADINFGEGERLVQYVADSQDNVGLGASVAVNAEGLPFISYFGFPEELEEGEIAAPRPIGAPFVPGVLVTSATADGVFSRGAVETIEPASVPLGVFPAYRPVLVPDLPLSPDNANGTTTAVAEDGTIHVAWTGASGVSYASVQYQKEAEVELVYDAGSTIQQAGPVGRPEIVLDDLNRPWIAFAADSVEGIDVIVAHPEGDGWVVEKVATASRCNGCAGPLPTGIGIAGGAPTVVFADPGAGSVRGARLTGDIWAVADIATGVTGSGISAAGDGDRLVATYYAGAGSVAAAVWDGGWTVVEVGASADPEDASGSEAPSTDVALAGDEMYATWQDGDEIRLARGDGASFEELDIGSPEGSQPTVAASDAGAFVAWYDPTSMDLMLGVLGEPEEIFLANPSPAPTVSIAPTGPADCGDEGVVDLAISGSGQLFDKDCLVAPAEERFTITFDNQDGTHNIELSDIAPSEGGEIFAATDVLPGPVEQTLDVEPLAEDDYYFQCQIHPTTMFGTLAVVEGAK